MCGRFETTSLTWAEIHAQLSRFAPVATAPLNLEPSSDVRPTTAQLTARLDAQDGWVLEKMRWGLVPFWRADKPLKDTTKGAGDGFKLSTFNARAEGCATSAVFKGAYSRRRCIVPASAWFEWRGETIPKPKFRFTRADGSPIWFAGLWDRVATSDAGELASFTLITGPSGGQLADYHDRAPAVLEPEDWASWLDPSIDAGRLLASLRPERFMVTPAAAA